MPFEDGLEGSFKGCLRGSFKRSFQGSFKGCGVYKGSTRALEYPFKGFRA